MLMEKESNINFDRELPPHRKLASQNANIMLMEKESNINFDRELPPHTKLCRYVDNIVCLCPADQLISTIRIVHSLLRRAYGVSLRVEQVGTSLTSLQFQIYWQMMGLMFIGALKINVSFPT